MSELWAPRGLERIGAVVGPLVGVAVLAAPFVLGAATGADAEDGSAAKGETVFAFADTAIVESSGLVSEDRWVHTTNDSGDTGRVFTVDAATGQTVGTTTWSRRPDDVEALAPAGAGHVWVGDIGDNTTSRESVMVTRVPVGAGERQVAERQVRLTYPGPPRDAEALLAHPVTGRLYLVTKGVFAGELHKAPADLSGTGPHPLTPIGQVTGMVTDGAFLPDGRHLVLRTYSRAVLYEFPTLRQVASWRLPRQQQGEGLAVEAAGGEASLLLSSEGLHAPVLRVAAPVAVPVPAAAAQAPPSGILAILRWLLGR